MRESGYRNWDSQRTLLSLELIMFDVALQHVHCIPNGDEEALSDSFRKPNVQGAYGVASLNRFWVGRCLL